MPGMGWTHNLLIFKGFKTSSWFGFETSRYPVRQGWARHALIQGASIHGIYNDVS